MTKPKRSSKRSQNLIIPLLIILALTFGLLGLSYGQFFAMYRVGDAFKEWTGVELNGKLYPPDAGDGPSWKFWVDPDLNKYGRSGGYPKPGSPECGGTADLNIRSVSGRGLYVTDSGFLVQVIEVKGQWVDTSYQVKCGRNLCSRPCGEKIGDAWVYVKLDKNKFRGGMPIYIEVSDKSVEDWIKFAESETKVIANLKWEAEQGDQNAVQIRWLGHVEGGELQQQVPFLWFPDNSTLKFKLTGLMKVMEDYGALYKSIHYYVYIAPPENKMFKAIVKKEVTVLTTRKTYNRGSCPEVPSHVPGTEPWKLKDRVILEREGPRPVKVKCIYTKKVTKTNIYYKLVEAEVTPQPVATTMSKIVMEDETITTETYATTVTVNKLVEKTVTLEKTTTKTIGGVTVTETVPATTVTLKAPKTTYTITDSHQAQAVAEAYQPPKPLTEVIYEKLMELYYWLLDALGLR